MPMLKLVAPAHLNHQRYCGEDAVKRRRSEKPGVEGINPLPAAPTISKVSLDGRLPPKGIL